MTLYHKMRKILLQNATAILLQNVTEVYYKMRRFFISKCDSYYKMRRSLQIPKVHSQISPGKKKLNLTACAKITMKRKQLLRDVP